MPSASAIAPITFGNTAPPIIAITINEDASFDFSQKPQIHSEKMVGNIIDIKKAIPITATRAGIPLANMATAHNAILIRA